MVRAWRLPMIIISKSSCIVSILWVPIEDDIVPERLFRLSWS